MIGFLEGELLDKTTGQAMVKVGGVGYLVLIPLSTFYALPEAPAPVSLQILTASGKTPCMAPLVCR